MRAERPGCAIGLSALLRWIERGAGAGEYLTRWLGPGLEHQTSTVPEHGESEQQHDGAAFLHATR